MCGIAGIIKKSNRDIDWDVYTECFKESMYHRGPDQWGEYRDSQIAVVHTRLSIVDISGGRQPIYSDNDSIGLIYNGEIYNHVVLRRKLESYGYTFKTNTDTEVVLRYYEEFGTKAFEQFNGMFAFCLWDTNKDLVYLVRDHIGIKPLYLYEDDEKYLFASELKTILASPELNLELEPQGFQDYLTFRYIQAPYTFFKKIRIVEAGTYCKFSQGNKSQFRYWDISYKDSFPPKDFHEASEELTEKLHNAVKSQLMGEVPIGVLLSGGLDSSAIAYYVHKCGADLTTYNIGFPEINEFQFSNAVAEKYGLKHITIETTIDELISSIETIFMAIDSPIADPACLPLFRLGDVLKQTVTVVLSGEGSDEIFSGYPQYVNLLTNPPAFENRFERFLSKSWYFSSVEQFLRNKNLTPEYLRYRKYFDEQPFLNGMLAYDMKTWIPENLMMKADKILMAHSLEGRFPFLDKEVIEFAACLPQNYKLHPKGLSKWILKNSMNRYLPEIVLNRKKMGFSIPLALMLGKLKLLIIELANSLENTELDEILDADRIKKVINSYFTNNNGQALLVWTIFVMLYWFQIVYPNIKNFSVKLPSRQTSFR